MADQEITIAEAADTIRTLCRQRIRESRSYDKLEATIALALTLETAIVRLTNSRDRLSADVAAMETTHAEHLATMRAETDALVAQNAELETRGSTRRAELGQEIEQLQRTAQMQDVEIQQRAEAAERTQADVRLRWMQESEQAGMVHRQRMESLEKEIRAAEARLRTAQADFKDFAEGMVTRVQTTANLR